MEPSSTSRLIPVPKWNEYHPWPPLGGLRHLIFHAPLNGFDTVLRRVGTVVHRRRRRLPAQIDFVLSAAGWHALRRRAMMQRAA